MTPKEKNIIEERKKNDTLTKQNTKKQIHIHLTGKWYIISLLLRKWDVEELAALLTIYADKLNENNKKCNEKTYLQQ